MQPAPPTDASPAIVRLDTWFLTPPGQYVRQWEQARLDALVEDAFGFVAVQAGLAGFHTLRANRIPFQLCVAADAPEELRAVPRPAWHGLVAGSAEAMPLATQSVDLLVLPHALEYAQDPHAVLREAERVLVPEGRLIIAGFNPWSLWGARHRLGRADWLPQGGQFIGLHRLKDWLKLLSFELDRGHFGCYALPVASPTWLRRSSVLDKAGDRWWPVAGAVYLVSAIKRTHGTRLIGPAWKKRRRRASARAQVALNRRPSSSSHGFPHE
ncbi:MAG: class I SAM-dependent methyltransferase [Pigmentiphaga sp.]|nr:class I SAM-dependent methyltransferase [Pigmentiphaga sp.]